MLQLRDTRILRNLHANVATGVLIPEEGLALSWVKENGEAKVRPSTGAANEIFAGVSFERFAPPGRVPLVIEAIVDEDGKVELPRVPAAGQISAFQKDGSAYTIVSGPAGAETEAQLDGSELIFDADTQAGKFVRVQMLYVPSVEEARSFQGDLPFGGHASQHVAVIGRVTQGEIGTSAVDMSKDWTSALFVKLGADGVFTPGTANDHLDNVVVMNTPNAANPFLCLSLNVG